MHSHNTHTVTKKKNGKEYEIKFYIHVRSYSKYDIYFTFFAVPFLLLLTFYFYLGIIRTTGRSEAKNFINIRLEIKY
jgi:hypothetical protein